MNLEAERPRRTQTRGAPEALERDEGRRAREREPGGEPNHERPQRRLDGRVHDPPRVSIEWVRGAVRRLAIVGLEAIEERWSARTDDERGARAGKQPREPRPVGNRGARSVERVGIERQQDVEPDRRQRPRQPIENLRPGGRGDPADRGPAVDPSARRTTSAGTGKAS